MATLTAQSAIDALAATLRERGHAGTFARKLDISIAEASRFISRLVSAHPHLAEKFKYWPKNVTTGYVFIGDIHKQNAENSDILKVGHYVLANCWNKKRNYYDIFRADTVVETEFIFGRQSNGKFYPAYRKPGEFLTKWLSQEDIDLGLAVKFGEENGCNVKIRTENTREVYRRGAWLGTVSSRALINVNYDWR